MRLRDKVALVTGAASVFGADIARSICYSLVTCADVASHRPFRRARVSV